MATKSARNRREDFRLVMEALTTGAVPGQAITKGFYVPSPEGSLAERLVPRVDLRPSSTHLVVGGIGTGKTTQLLVAERQFSRVADVQPIYIDVSAHHDLAKLTRGVLVVVAGLALDGLLKSAGSDAAQNIRREFRRWAEGFTTWYEQPDYEDYEHDSESGRPAVAVRTPGLLVPSEPPLDSELKRRAESLRELVLASEPVVKKEHFLFFFDSLDRVSDFEAFANLVNHDVRALKEAGVGVVLVGPLRVLFGANRPLTDRFDHTYHISAVDTRTAEGPAFLAHVLKLRAPSGILGPGVVSRLALLSGGVLRDLIALTQASVEEAYIAGGESVTEEHVHKAADSFGRNLMLGLGADEIAVLQRVREKGAFIQTSDKDIALLVTRRVLEYGEGRSRYAVHPTIEPLLTQLAEHD